MTRRENYKKQWPRKNLGELVNFLEERHPDGLSLEVLAKEFGITKGSFSNLFNRDNMKLSRAEQIARHYGYTLKLFFPVRRHEDGYRPAPFIREYTDTGNLTGMYMYIRDSGYSIEFVAEMMGVSSNVVRRALSRGDIQIATLNRFLDALGISCIWRFEKDNKPNN